MRDKRKVGFEKKNPVLQLYIGGAQYTLLISFQLKTPKDPESTTSSGNSPDLTIMSRPMSEESSVWDDNESNAEVRRRHNKIQVCLFKKVAMYLSTCIVTLEMNKY